MDDVAGGLTLLERFHQGECWDRQPGWSLARALDKSSFFTPNVDHVTNAIKRRRHDSDHGLTLLESVLKERDEGKLSGPYQAPPSWEVEMSPLLPQF